MLLAEKSCYVYCYDADQQGGRRRTAACHGSQHTIDSCDFFPFVEHMNQNDSLGKRDS